MIEKFLTVIAAAVFKKAACLLASEAIGSKLVVAGAKAYEVYSAIEAVTECVKSINSCEELRVSGVRIVSDVLASEMLDRFLEIDGHTFTVDQRKSGVFIASSLAPTFRAGGLEFPDFQRRRFPQFKKAEKSRPIVRRFPEIG